MAGNFPFVDISGPITSGRQYGPGKAGTRLNWFMNRTAAATELGSVTVCDVTDSDGSADVEGPTDLGIWSQLIAPTTAFLDGGLPGFVVVAQGAAADNVEVMGCWHGYTEALVIDASNSPVLGSQLTLVNAADYFDAIVDSDERRFAFLMETMTTPSAAGGTLGRVCLLYEGMFQRVGAGMTAIA